MNWHLITHNKKAMHKNTSQVNNKVGIGNLMAVF